ncbi:glycosyl hydrolase family 28-related protein [Dinoroseobacter sp. S124A]|uniref:glycosyl hydrolase family 28-related protein n=1 Tax=Dinoroseobacter sp. S124A TaxID=3415128 RepID=UPI003C7CBEDD
MPTIAEGESLASIRAKLNTAFDDTETLKGSNYPIYADTAAMAAATLADGDRAQVGDLVFERQSSDTTTLPNQPGFVPAAPKSTPHISHFGGVGDGVTDNTAVMEAIKAFCTASGEKVDFGSGGTYLIDPLRLEGSETLFLTGDPNNRPVLKLKPGPDGHVLNTATDSTAVFDLYGVCLDGNRGTRAAGHGLRSAGCNLVRLDQVRIQNCQSYGLGIQNGTTQRVEIGYLEIDTTGKDAIDIKDRDNDNGIFVFDHIRVLNHALDDADDAALDARGPVYGRLLTVEMSGAALGMRYRADGNGRAGFGSVQTVAVTGPGLGGGTTVACSFETSDPRSVVGEVIAQDVSTVLLQSGVGGRVGRITGTGIYGGDGVSLRGRGFLLEGGHIIMNAAASFDEVLEITASAQDATVRALTIDDPTGGENLITVEAGATGSLIRECILISAGITGAGITDAGTGTIIDQNRIRTS